MFSLVLSGGALGVELLAGVCSERDPGLVQEQTRISKAISASHLFIAVNNVCNSMYAAMQGRTGITTALNLSGSNRAEEAPVMQLR